MSFSEIRQKIDPYYRRQQCSPGTTASSGKKAMRRGASMHAAVYNDVGPVCLMVAGDGDQLLILPWALSSDAPLRIAFIPLETVWLGNIFCRR